MEPAERSQAIADAARIKDGFTINPSRREERIARALIDATDREAGYRERIEQLQDAVERTAAAGVENAARYAADLAAERRAGAERVERIRAAMLAGAADAAQARATACALRLVLDELAPSKTPSLHGVCQAYLAQGQALAEAQALLSDIGTKALALLGKGVT